jgi:hypothetical protein
LGAGWYGHPFSICECGVRPSSMSFAPDFSAEPLLGELSTGEFVELKRLKHRREELVVKLTDHHR